MKRICLLLLAAMLLLPLTAGSEEAPAYEAYAALDFNIRREAGSEYRLLQVKDGDFLQVYEYGEEWCKVGVGETVGYCKTGWLWGFHSLDAMRYPVPGRTVQTGALQLGQDTWIEGGKFKGVLAGAGSILCITEAKADGYHLPVWRGEGVLPLDSGGIIAFVPWEDAKPGNLIGGFTTYYNEKTGKELAAARAYNIQEACRRIQDALLHPGDSFSYNALCGPYTKENGYKMAPNISRDGKGYGGGVCQVTTTLYNALLALPLQIDEWTVHRRSGVDYIPQYFDAAVGSYTDLRFTNTLPYPIRIAAMDQEGVVTVLIYRQGEK